MQGNLELFAWHICKQKIGLLKTVEMECKLCLLATSESSEIFGKLLKWAQFILQHINVTCSVPFTICHDCAERLKGVRDFCEFLEQRQLANQKIISEAEETDANKMDFVIKLELKLEGGGARLPREENTESRRCSFCSKVFMNLSALHEHHVYECHLGEEKTPPSDAESNQSEIQ